MDFSMVLSAKKVVEVPGAYCTHTYNVIIIKGIIWDDEAYSVSVGRFELTLVYQVGLKTLNFV